MSHSPITDFSPSILQKYKNRWNALARLLHADRSFSGGERHSAFLNVQGERFVDMSAVTGFDFSEDGRALITEDWDFDGDLDVWVTARTSPRVRLLENQLKNSEASLFIRLHGNGTNTNAEAIGARCEVWLKDNDQPLTRTVKAGDSFLSQASSWLHYGLGGNDDIEIERVIVHWPAGQKEEFTGLNRKGRFLLYQGQSQAKNWNPPLKKQSATQAQPLQLPAETEQARIVLPSPLLLPLLETEKGEAIDPLATSEKSGPVLVNLWSHTCSSCLHELKEWTKSSSAFQKAGLGIIALNVDAVAQDDLAEKSAEAQKFLDEINFPYPAQATNGDTLQRLDLFQRSFLDRWLPLPVPCSFLIDENGKTTVIYKGPVTAETLLADLALLDADSESRRKAGTPFSGLWIDTPPFNGPKRYISQLLDHKKLADLERYYKRYLAVERTSPSPSTGPMIEAIKTLAKIATQRKKYSSAVSYLEEAVALVPQAPDLKLLLKEAQETAAKFQKINLKPFLAKVETEPTNAKAHLTLADAYRQNGEITLAVKSYKNALKNEPKLFVAEGRLAWILATHPSTEIRDPKLALEFANKLMALNGGKDPSFLDLQGIALAANGNFTAAADKAHAALQFLKEESPYKKEVQYRLDLYQKKKPYYEGSSSP